jgi:16S rRNA (guanine527-N7)-methyltransferase
MDTDAFEDFPLEEAIVARAARCGVELAPASTRALATQARAVIEANPGLHLTTIVDPQTFVERHLGEAFEGAALLPAGIEGTLLDLGSGNGYPGLPLAAARPGLRPVLAEASVKKAAFLRGVVERSGLVGARVLARQVQRPADLEGIEPLQVIATRAASGWEKVVPRLIPCLVPGGRVLVWAGESMETVRRRAAWKRLEMTDRVSLPGRQRSWVWVLGAVAS